MLVNMMMRVNGRFAHSLNSNFNMQRMILGASYPCFNFSSHLPDGDNTNLIPEGMIEREQKMYQERVSEKDKKVMEANRLASIQLGKEFNEYENAWWNKLANITKDEMKMMPTGFVKKYGSLLANLRRYEGDNKLKENRDIEDYY